MWLSVCVCVCARARTEGWLHVSTCLSRIIRNRNISGEAEILGTYGISVYITYNTHKTHTHTHHTDNKTLRTNRNTLNIIVASLFKLPHKPANHHQILPDRHWRGRNALVRTVTVTLCQSITIGPVVERPTSTNLLIIHLAAMTVTKWATSSR